MAHFFKKSVPRGSLEIGRLRWQILNPRHLTKEPIIGRREMTMPR